jgi:polyisoprenoid-binding protein YceI
MVIHHPGAQGARCTVLTFKEGLLSKIAHDLRIAVGRFEISWTGSAVAAIFQTTSLKVETPMRDGRADPDLLSKKDLLSIEATMRDEVLETRRFPQVRFQGEQVDRSEGRRTVRGMLTLHGVERPLTMVFQPVSGAGGVGVEGELWRGTTELDQRDFGITPYKAMLGTLRIQPRVRVELIVPDPD